MRKICVLLLVCFGLVTPIAAPAEGIGLDALSPKTARMIRDAVNQANRDFKNLPQVRLSIDVTAICSGDDQTNRLMRYCTSQNTIFVSSFLNGRVESRDAAGYMIAHMLGHGVQVRNGVADKALAMIRADPDNVAELRGMVERQVECIAGVIYARAGYDPAMRLRDINGGQEVFADKHWGRNPLTAAQIVRIGPEASERWFETGRDAGDYSVCSVGKITYEMLRPALN